MKAILLKSLLVMAIALVWNILIVHILNRYTLPFLTFPEPDITYFIPLTLNSIKEEFFFRFIPFLFFFIIARQIKGEVLKGMFNINEYTLPLILLTSLLFGYMHGNMLNIALQGVSGFAFAYIFLLGMNWPARINNHHTLMMSIFTGFALSSVFHILWNWLILLSYLVG